MTAVAIIPARYQSTRLPGKVLAEIAGQPLIYYVYKRVQKASKIERVIVATDDERIKQTVEAFGGVAVMTSSGHQSGTERIAEVAALLPHDIVINVQADEPLVRPEVLDSLVYLMESDLNLPMATVATPLQDLDELDDPNVVKLVMDLKGHALYFTRAPIPFPFLPDTFPMGQIKEIVSYRNDLIQYFHKHVGVYAYRRSFLLQLVQLPPTPLEKLERLEQLRAIENGFRIRVIVTLHEHLGVDTQKDLIRLKKMVEANPSLLHDLEEFH